jgi:hypothetical protein
MKFTGIPELLDELNKGLGKLNQGALSVQELEGLTEVSRELHERLIIIRYKAYTNEASDESSAITVAAEPAEQNLPKEVIVEQVKQEEEPSVPSPAPLAFGFDFKVGAAENLESEPVKTPVKEEKKQSIPVEKSKEAVASGSSINDKLANEASSLAEKLGKSKIEDLRKAIGLNQKFGLISDLFGGDADSYDLALDRFNSCTDMEEATSLFNEEKRARKWEDEDSQALELYSLIERRYL